MKAALVALASLLIPAPVATAAVDQTVIDPSAIVQVICPTDNGYSAGSAFRVGKSLAVSVKHVTSAGHCYVPGHDSELAYQGEKQDFAMLKIDAGPYLVPDCGGFGSDQ